MLLNPVSLEQSCVLVEDFHKLSSENARVKMQLRNRWKAPVFVLLSSYWRAKGVDQNKIQNETFFKEYHFDSTVDICESMLYKVQNANVIPHLAHVLLSESETIMERFGSISQFAGNMKDWGSYFGYSSEESKFDIDTVNPHYRAFTLPQKFFSEKSFSAILISNDDNDKCFTHWILLRLLDLYLAEPIIARLPNPLLVFSYAPKIWQLQSISYFFPHTKFSYAIIDTPTLFNQLYLIQSPSNNLYSADYLSFLYQGFRARTIPQPRRRVFVSRGDAITRRLINQTELAPLFAKYDFVVVELEKMSFEEQTKLVGNASVFIFISGSSGLNLMYAMPDISVGIIQTRDTPEHWKQVCHVFGIANVRLFEAIPVDSRSLESSISVDYDRFDQFLREMIS